MNENFKIGFEKTSGVKDVMGKLVGKAKGVVRKAKRKSDFKKALKGPAYRRYDMNAVIGSKADKGFRPKG